jgi:hypothetical protein
MGERNPHMHRGSVLTRVVSLAGVSAAHRIPSNRDLWSIEMVKTKNMPATPSTIQKTAKTPVVTHAPEGDISRRAYSLFQARGSEHGHDVEDWFLAEAELVTGKNTKIASTSAKTQRRLG